MVGSESELLGKLVPETHPPQTVLYFRVFIQAGAAARVNLGN